MNRYGFRAKIYFLIGLLNLILAIPLGIKYGGIGCAFATGVSMLVGNGIIMNWFYSRSIKLDIKQFWWEIGKISAVVLVCLFIGYGIYYGLPVGGKIGFVVKIILYTIIYGVIIYKFAMSDGEKIIIRTSIYNLKRIL